MNHIQHRPLALALTAALATVLAAPAAFAGVVPADGEVVVGPGAPAERWTVGTGGTLIVQPGAEVIDIVMNGAGTLRMDGATVSSPSSSAVNVLGTATISNSSLTSTNREALRVTNSAQSSPDRTTVNISGSTIRSEVNAVLMGARTDLALSNTSVVGGIVGITSFGGRLSVLGGSRIEGVAAGIRLRAGDISMDAPGESVIDGSTVEGLAGPAILVQGASSGGASAETRIAVRNGSQLIGGNGNVLEVSTTGTDLPIAYFDVQSSALRGNIVVGDDGSQGHVTLSNGGSITGAFSNVTSATLDNGGRWQMSGDSSVGTLALNDGGTLALGDGSTFNTLSVDTFTGNGGIVLFNTVLGADGSNTDLLHVLGETRGTASVAVNNVGGAGAQTVNGIELIRVDGASNGQFNLAGRAVGGQYEYFLHKGGVAGGEGNWYLRSQLPTAPDPCDADPTLPDCGGPVVPVLRPEGGAYLANLTASQAMFRLGYHDRQAGQNGGRGWARVDGSRSGFDAVSRQLDVQGNSQALSVGADLLRNAGGSAVGVMLSTGNASSTSTHALTGYYARGKVKGVALGVYGTWRAPHEDLYSGFYVDGSLQRAQFRNRVEGLALTPERYDSKAWQGAVEAGYALRVGGAANGGLYLEPQLQVGYNRWDDLRHTEANGTVVTTRDADGLFGRAGVRLSGVTRWGTSAAQVQPYVAAHWLHQRAPSSVLMDDEVVDARIPRSRGEFSAGASLKFANGVGAWGGLSLQRASGYHQTSAQVGLSYSW
ncbi:autotransporter outer membrane beta-barrel domain-containing protein [Stenotrophomonas sp. NPDC077659]|uniref:autotransporter family protein n=1 Tax=Stenotrophomonas sp. NPDC077659 TaxID=3390694 RepID=UPI003CFD9C46